MQMIRLNDYVGIRYNIISHSDNFEIFDITIDPQQAKNLDGNPGMEIIQQQMKDKVLQSRRPNESAKRPYDDEFVPAAKVAKTTEGVVWKAFKGNFLWVPDVVTLTPSGKGTSDRPNTNVNKADYQSLFFTGYIKIPADGEYAFFLSTNQGAVLRIHDATVIDADFGYASGTELKGEIKLKAGLHPFRLYYTNKTGIKPSLDFQWSGPSISKQPVPSSAFIRNSKI